MNTIPPPRKKNPWVLPGVMFCGLAALIALIVVISREPDIPPAVAAVQDPAAYATWRASVEQVIRDAERDWTVVMLSSTASDPQGRALYQSRAQDAYDAARRQLDTLKAVEMPSNLSQEASERVFDASEQLQQAIQDRRACLLQCIADAKGSDASAADNVLAARWRADKSWKAAKDQLQALDQRFHFKAS